MALRTATHWSSRRWPPSRHITDRFAGLDSPRPSASPLRRYMLSEDPDFEKKAADIIGLYLAPPDHAAVFCVDERLLSKPWTAWILSAPFSRQGRSSWLEDYRHGTLSLYAALDTRSGEILQTAQRHTSTEFVDFLAHVVASQPLGREIHVIADNLSAHKTKLVEEFWPSIPKSRKRKVKKTNRRRKKNH